MLLGLTVKSISVRTTREKAVWWHGNIRQTRFLTPQFSGPWNWTMRKDKQCIDKRCFILLSIFEANRISCFRDLDDPWTLLGMGDDFRGFRDFLDTMSYWASFKKFVVIPGRVAVLRVLDRATTIDISRTRRCTNSVVSTSDLARNPSWASWTSVQRVTIRIRILPIRWNCLALRGARTVNSFGFFSTVPGVPPFPRSHSPRFKIIPLVSLFLYLSLPLHFLNTV